MQIKNALRINKVAIATGGTYDYVKSDRVPPGQIWCLQGQSYENRTGARGTFRRYIESLGPELFLGEQPNPGAGELVFTDKPVFLYQGECLTVRQASCTAADVLALYVHGYIIYLDEVEE